MDNLDQRIATIIQVVGMMSDTSSAPGQEYAASLGRIARLESLREHLQWAIELEHFTLPPYLCALYSLNSDRNPEAAEVVSSVMVEEMLHMTLAANLLNAVGGRPRLDIPEMLPGYPNPLPHGDRSLEISLFRFCPEAVEIQAIEAAPNRVHQHVVDTSEVGLEIHFTPGATGIQFSHLSYNLPHDEVHNVLYQAFERKSDQIKRAGRYRDDELAGVIVCDGGCAMLRTTRGVNNRAVDQVVDAFLRGSRTIDFVCVVDVVHTSTYNFASPLRFDVRGWAKPQTPCLLGDIVVKAFKSLPTPIDNAINKLGQFRFAANIPRNLGRYRGAGVMSHRQD